MLTEGSREPWGMQCVNNHVTNAVASIWWKVVQNCDLLYTYKNYSIYLITWETIRMKEAVKITILTRRELPKVKGFDFGALPPRPRSDTQHVSVTIHQMRSQWVNSHPVSAIYQINCPLLIWKLFCQLLFINFSKDLTLLNPQKFGFGEQSLVSII